jgi:hypothetical protein
VDGAVCERVDDEPATLFLVSAMRALKMLHEARRGSFTLAVVLGLLVTGSVGRFMSLRTMRLVLTVDWVQGIPYPFSIGPTESAFALKSPRSRGVSLALGEWDPTIGKFLNTRYFFIQQGQVVRVEEKGRTAHLGTTGAPLRASARSAADALPRGSSPGSNSTGKRCVVCVEGWLCAAL